MGLCKLALAWGFFFLKNVLYKIIELELIGPACFSLIVQCVDIKVCSICIRVKIVTGVCFARRESVRWDRLFVTLMDAVSRAKCIAISVVRVFITKCVMRK